MKTTTWIFLLIVGLAGLAHATPQSGFTGTQLAKGTYDDIDINNLFTRKDMSQATGTPAGWYQNATDIPKLPWRSLLQTDTPSDVYVQSNTWAPGGTTGWHSHPGSSLIMVTSGTVTVYHGEDPTCKPETYTAGQSFIDYGGDDTHVIRNETATEAKSVAVQIIPSKANRRIDRPANPACGF